MDDYEWNELVARIRQGNVVLVVGSQLLLDPKDGTPLYARVAQKMMSRSGQKPPQNGLPKFRELNAVVAQLKDSNVRGLPYLVSEALKELREEGLEIPTALGQLAQITDLKLMVSLTPDDLLARALLGENRALNSVVYSPKLSKKSDSGEAKPSLKVGEWNRPDSPAQLLYLFGDASKPPLFALHDEDLLEYAHNIIAHGSNAPDDFLAALRERDLLMIGCNFPDWLSRFVLRATRSERLIRRGGDDEPQQFLVERLDDADPFCDFLRAYSPSTKLLSDQEPVNFVAELHRRWMAQARQVSGRAMPAEAPATNIPQRALFFISYSRGDLASAQKLHQALRDLGVAEHEVWFDQTELQPGQQYEQRIFEGISNCKHFLPLVSRGVTEREEAFVFSEWEAATKRLPKLNRPPDRPFLVPVVLDAENKPEHFDKPSSLVEWRNGKINFGHAPMGVPDEKMLGFLQGLVRLARNPGGEG